MALFPKSEWSVRRLGVVPGHRASWSLEEMFERLGEDKGLMRVESWAPLGKDSLTWAKAPDSQAKAGR